MKTYLMIWYNSSSDCSNPSEVNSRLMSLGFKPMQGSFDYVYEWNKAATVEDVLRFGDKIHLSLMGTGVFFKIETD
ncbi:hypothetical protein MsAg5_16410 [Methanosarcinaceae archaeon Ag5]|uniref:Uncharacterized protein n=1 Tax=Methanolapillus africanus TaxID=3028297 RepID=A0AAE4SEF6_9EURY|nr:hypothetical protein [Methanosarcinaceae archaeon Ag5]